MKQLEKLTEKVTSLKHNKEELEFLKNSSYEKKMNFKHILKSHSFCNEEEFSRLKTTLENIFLNRVEMLESEIREYKILKDGI